MSSDLLRKHVIPILSTLGLAGISLAGLPAVGASAEPVGASAQAVEPAIEKLLVSDDFARTAASGWGNAGKGLPYAYVGPASFTSNGAKGIVDLPKPGSLRSASIPAVSVLDAAAAMTITLPSLPQRGNGLYSAVHLRVDGGYNYQATVRVAPSGAMYLKITRTDGSAKDQVVVAKETKISGTAAAGRDIQVVFQATGTDAVALRAKAWVDGSTEPKWQAVADDTSSKRIKTAGSVGTSNYISSSSGAQKVAVDDFKVVSLKTTTATTPVAPAPEPTPAPAPAPTPAPTPTPAPAPIAPAPAPAPVPAPAPAPAPAPVVPAPEVPAPAPTPVGEASPRGFRAGVPAGTNLQVHEGDLVVTTPGQVIDGLDIRGRVTIKADGVVIKNSRITGSPVSSSQALVSNYSSGNSFTIVDSELAATTPSPWINGIMGSNFVAERVNVHNVIDAIHITGGNVTVRNAWLHDNLHFAVDPNHNNTPSHDDSIQIGGGSNILIADSWLEDANNAAVMITQDVARTSNVQFRNNHLDGGDCTVNVSDKGQGSITGLEFTSNVFGLNRAISYCAVYGPAGSAPAMNQNVWQATGKTVEYITK